jgi:hypothetical protein
MIVETKTHNSRQHEVKSMCWKTGELAIFGQSSQPPIERWLHAASRQLYVGA